MMPANYADSCGPLALAALTGMSATEAADELWRLQLLRGRLIAPGTLPEDLLLSAARRGRRFDAWTTTAGDFRQTEAASDLIERLRDEMRRDAAAHRAPERIEAPTLAGLPADGARVRKELERVSARARTKYVLVGEFLSLAGTWLLSTAPEFVVGDAYQGHFIVITEGRVTAGDQPDCSGYRATPVRAAWKLNQPGD